MPEAPPTLTLVTPTRRMADQYPWDRSLIPSHWTPKPDPEAQAKHSSTRLRLSNSPRNTLAVCILATFGAIKREDLMPAGLRDKQAATLAHYERIRRELAAGKAPEDFATPVVQSAVLDEALKTRSPLSAKFRSLYEGMLRLRRPGDSA
jgi:hypothetical protein